VVNQKHLETTHQKKVRFDVFKTINYKIKIFSCFIYTFAYENNLRNLIMKHIAFFILFSIIGIYFISCDNTNDSPEPENQIPNPDFEKWVLENEFDKPESWNTSSFSLYNMVTFNTVFKDSLTFFSGNYSSRLETKGQIINSELVKVVGLITLGNFDINIATKKAHISGGIPFQSKPISLTGYYKYNAVGDDNCFMDIALTKLNNQKKQDTIAHGRFSSGSVSDWTSFELNLQYFSEDIPDSLNIVFLSSDTSIFEAGSTLWIDNLSLTYN